MISIEASVIIPTYNGEKKISNVLNGLLRQTFKEFEVIVVIDGSTDNTLEVVERFRPSFTHLKIIGQSNQGRSKVRNRGVLDAAGDLIIFYDDDMVPFDDSVERHIEFHKTHKGIVSGFSLECQSPGKTDIQNYKAHLSKVWTTKYSDGVTRLNLSILFFTAANASIKKNLFDLLGGFNENLTDAEDHDLACRALIKNIPVFFDKDNRAVHNDLISCQSYIKRLRLYAIAHAQLKKYHPERYSDARKKNLFKRIIYRIFAIRLWVSLIDREVFVWLLPQKIRYKLYDVVIQALGIEYPDVVV
jgi:glycosyltransferase involved in cell wall biosynthesis